MHRHIFAASVIGLLCLAPVTTSLHADGARYVVENLGTIDGLVPTVTGFNESGEVSGYVSGDAGLRAVLYHSGVWSYVPGLESVYSAAMAINASGDLTGYEMSESGQLVPFRYSDGVGVVPLNTLSGGAYAIGMAINANGDIVGYGNTDSGTHAWIARAGGGADPVLLPTLGGTFSLACGINDRGQITGSATTSDNYPHAFRIDPGGAIADLGTLDGPTATSTACAIDSDGHVGGQSSHGAASHAFLFADGTLSDLDSFGSSVSTVNSTSAGVSVGSFLSSDGVPHAMVHTNADGSADLNDRIPAESGWFLSDATSVNSKGQIAGTGTLAGVAAVYRLTPVGGDVTPPTIASVAATPSSVTPPNRAMVAIAISATATDAADPGPVCAVTAVDGHGAPSGDSAITGPLAALVRATGGSTYSFTVTCHDASGNAASRDVDVVVPPDTTAPSIAGATANPSMVSPANGAMVPVTVSVSATDDSEAAPVCSLDSIASAGAAAGDSSVTGQFAGLVRAVAGRTYSLRVACSDAAGNTASSTVDVVVSPDTTPPSIARLTANPSTVSRANGSMVPVSVSVSATDDSDVPPFCRLEWISSKGAGPEDSTITGPLTALVRAVGGRTYTLGVACHDAAGNAAAASVNVVVPRDTTAPSITSLMANPSRIRTARGRSVNVAVSVSATDDVDAAPVCALSSIAGGWPGDATITGPLSASVRTSRNATYTLQVTCRDHPGNKAQGSVTVTVLKDGWSRDHQYDGDEWTGRNQDTDRKENSERRENSRRGRQRSRGSSR